MVSDWQLMVGLIKSSMVIVLVTGTSVLPHASVAVHVSVTVPPHAVAGIAEKVERFDVPVIRQPPAPEFV